MSIVNAKIVVSGSVQGVGYRWFADRIARKHELYGFVENRPDGTVFLEVEGERKAVEECVKDLKTGPRSASVTNVAVEWGPPHHLFIAFKIKA
ncbi:MAG: acylphosphatase [Bacteroidetes bacterium]|nr:MAG: acylphosphatase [Bacteroidota bacterium]